MKRIAKVSLLLSLILIILAFFIVRILAPAARASAPVQDGESVVQRSCSMILTDAEFQAQDMSQEQVEAFLSAYGSVLAGMRSNGKLVSSIIFEAASTSRISPKVLLVTLQKEQGLIQSKTATPNALAYAMGYHKPSSLEQQIRDAAAQFRRYLDYPEKFPRRVGVINRLLDGSVFIANSATAALFAYTPVRGRTCGGEANVGGTGLFLALWQRYFQ